MFKTYYIFLFLAIFIHACDKNDPSMNQSNNNDAGAPAQMRFLALGDSYTIGQSVEEGQRWPVQLTDSLRSAGINLKDAEIIAQTGWTAGELMQAISNRDPQGPYDLVSLLIGVNNQYRGLDTSEYRMDLRELMQTAIALTANDATKVMVVSIPDYGVTPFARNMDAEKIAEEIDAFNAIKKNESMRAGITFINVTSISRLAADDPGLLADDKLHPSARMYAEWVKLIFPVAHGILKNK